jgi:hypothetical protein
VARAVMNTIQAKVARAPRVVNVSGNIINDISISTTLYPRNPFSLIFSHTTFHLLMSTCFVFICIQRIMENPTA